jgi:NAD(P)-dependent dehydrogenase (short-subunit alcohol dehydrogenase family)
MVFNPFALTNKTVLVTGASSGIGRVIAVYCSQMGANVVITGRNTTELERTFQLLEGVGNSMFIADINVDDEVDALVDSLPQLDGFVSNAGINKRALCRYVKDKDMDLIVKTNLTSPIALTKKILKTRKLNSSASVVFISSIAAYQSSIGDGVYSATKGGISSFSKVLALELAVSKIRVNSIQPAMVRTELIDHGPLTDEDYEKDERRYPLGRYGKPEDIAPAVIYLLSDAAVWVTGTDLVIDGGVSLV